MLGGSRLWEADTKTPVHRLLEGYTAGYLTGAACLMSVYVGGARFHGNIRLVATVLLLTRS
jgi:hypothetical protein